MVERCFTRTVDLICCAEQLLSHNDCRGAGEMNRTPDLRITNALLYQLSYTG